MTDKVMRTVERFAMLSNGGRVVVALSGGADSVSLLHVLYSIKEKYNLTLYAAHLNHQLRGEEAERDEEFCKILCEKYHIQLFVRHADVKALAAERKISEELCGRQERYAFFETLAADLNARVATAHTASDNAETLIFNLARGTSVTGAAGIPAVRLPYIRPLIACTRAEIERYCQANGLEYVTDSTNLTDDYTRNKLRHQVIPVLQELNPRFEEAVLRFCESAALAGDYLRQNAAALLNNAHTAHGYQAAVLQNAHHAVRSEALALLCQEYGCAAETRHLHLLTDILQHSGAVDLGPYTAVCKQGLLRFSPKEPVEPFTEIPLIGSITFEHNGKRISVTTNNSISELNDLVFRTRQSGDRFTFPKRNVTKSLRKALNEQKIPEERRDTLLLLCQGSTVLWCEELGFSKQGLALGLELFVN